LSGPIDAARTYQDYRREALPDYYGTVYLAQLFRLLDELNADGLIITTLPQARTRSRVDHLTFTNIPPVSGSRGFLYHLGMLIWSVRCIREIIRYRANVALLTAGQDYFWLFRVVSPFGIRLMASLHCTLWPNLAPRRAHKRLLIWLNGKFFYPACGHVQAVSDTIVAQIVGSSAALKVKPRKFVPTYAPSRFAAAVPPNWPSSPEAFRLLYVGRLEVNKGALDLVEIMRRLNADGPRRFELDACGEGGARERMGNATAEAGLEQAIRIFGQCATPLLARKFDQCHAVIVPTRSDFEEGYAKVAAEAVLNLRPVVMSAACPSLADVAAAAMEARVDDVEDYVRAIRELALDPALYAEKVQATYHCRQIYLDDRNSYGAVLKAGLARVLNG
jgi:glycosyltransferase involved in cell wall biosynthesis